MREQIQYSGYVDKRQRVHRSSYDSAHAQNAQNTAMRRVLIVLGTPIDDVTMAEAIDRIEKFVMVGRATGKSHQIATINADFVVKSLQDSELRQILQESDMATADGMPLVWGARLLGVPLSERVAGVDMVSALAQRAAQRDLSIFLLGAAPGIAEQTAAMLQKENPGLHIAGILAPSAEELQHSSAEIIANCRAAKPDILLVALGNPKQEKWIYHNRKALGIPVMMGVGGSFDLLAKVTRRAPRWMQQSGMEWLYRLGQEPGRLWKRYATDLFGFGIFFFQQWWIMRKGWGKSPFLPTADILLFGNTVIVTVDGRLDRQNLATFADQAMHALAADPYLIVNLASTEFLDSAAIGTLVALTKQARDAGGNLWLVNVPAPIARILSMLRLEQFFDICDDMESALALRRMKQCVPVLG